VGKNLPMLFGEFGRSGALAAMLYFSLLKCVFVSSRLLRGEAPLLREISSLISQKAHIYLACSA
jgi:hypothetical protein